MVYINLHSIGSWNGLTVRSLTASWMIAFRVCSSFFLNR